MFDITTLDLLSVLLAGTYCMAFLAGIAILGRVLD